LVPKKKRRPTSGDKTGGNHKGEKKKERTLWVKGVRKKKHTMAVPLFGKRLGRKKDPSKPVEGEKKREEKKNREDVNRKIKRLY